MSMQQVPTFIFTPGAAGFGTIQFTDFVSLSLNRIVLIKNITRGADMYVLGSQTLGGSVAGNTLTLNVDTSSMNAGDALFINYNATDDDPSYSSLPVSITSVQPGDDRVNNWKRVNHNNPKERLLLTSSTKTITGNTNTTPLQVGDFKEAVVALNVTAASGTTPTLDVKIQTSDDGGSTWYDLVYPNTTTPVAFAQATGVSKKLISLSGAFGDYLSIVYTIGGTSPSFTFAVKVVLK